MGKWVQIPGTSLTEGKVRTVARDGQRSQEGLFVFNLEEI